MADATKVLVVDDERLVLTSVATALRAAGFDVRTAQSGAEAVEIARQNPPDIIVTDLRMPEIDGLSLLHRVHAFSAASRMVVYSATPSTPELSSQVPEARWVAKTTDHRELIAMLQNE